MEQNLIIDGCQFTNQAGLVWDTFEFNCAPPDENKCLEIILPHRASMKSDKWFLVLTQQKNKN